MIESTAPKEDIQIRSDFTVHVDQRVLNTLCMEARKQGINYWDKELYSDVRNVRSDRKIPIKNRINPTDK